MANLSLNLHGDLLVPTTGTHGADIAAQRIDRLDRLALRHLLELSPDDEVAHPVCLDLGCGFGMQAARFAMLGADSWCYDLAPPSKIINAIANQGLQIHYVQSDLRLPSREFPANISIAYSQRFIHYLRYSEAKSLLKSIAMRMLSDAIFFISASGMHSELGSQYGCHHADIKERFGPLSNENREKHRILEDVCLYSERELTELLAASGYEAVSVWTSQFGNVKGVFRLNN